MFTWLDIYFKAVNPCYEDTDCRGWKSCLFQYQCEDTLGGTCGFSDYFNTVVLGSVLGAVVLLLVVLLVKIEVEKVNFRRRILFLKKAKIHFIFFSRRWITLQSLSRSPWWSSHGKTKTEAYPYNFYVSSTQRIGEGVSGDSLSGHLHPGRDRHEDRLDRSTCSGKPLLLAGHFHSL